MVPSLVLMQRGARQIEKATLAVVAVGWMADTSSEHLR
jgi:hypothetical protein